MSEIDDLYGQYKTLSLSRGRFPKPLVEFNAPEWSLKIAIELLEALPPAQEPA